MKVLLAALAVAMAALALVAATASALVLPTSVRIDYTQPKGSQYAVGGKLEVKRPCRLGRTVRLQVLHADGSSTVADTQKLTRSGVGLFTLHGAIAPGEGFVVTAAPLKVTLKSGKRVRCAAGSSAPVYPTT